MLRIFHQIGLWVTVTILGQLIEAHCRQTGRGLVESRPLYRSLRPPDVFILPLFGVRLVFVIDAAYVDFDELEECRFDAFLRIPITHLYGRVGAASVCVGDVLWFVADVPRRRAAIHAAALLHLTRMFMLIYYLARSRFILTSHCYACSLHFSLSLLPIK